MDINVKLKWATYPPPPTSIPLRINNSARVEQARSHGPQHFQDRLKFFRPLSRTSINYMFVPPPPKKKKKHQTVATALVWRLRATQNGSLHGKFDKSSLDISYSYS